MPPITLHPIGYIYTPFKDPKDAPIQPRRGKGVKGRIKLLPEFAEGLADLDGFSHIYLLYYLHLIENCKLRVVPFLDDTPRGLFATRAPCRPNPIGLSVVRLTKIEGSTLYIEDLDMVDGSPLLDIKPYVSEFDDIADNRIGWLTGKTDGADNTDADNRFK